MARWKVIVIKLCWVIRVYAIKNAAKLLLGNQNYLRIFGAVRRSAETPETPQVTRVIDGEVVGKPLEPGNGPVLIDPSLCVHPDQSMKKRGNRAQMRWTCKACQSR